MSPTTKPAPRPAAPVMCLHCGTRPAHVPTCPHIAAWTKAPAPAPTTDRRET